MKNFQMIGTFDPAPLLNQINRFPDLWDQNKLRTTHANSPHTEVNDIWVRFNDLKAYEETKDPSAVLDQHESIWYPAAERLKAVRPLIFWLMNRMEAIRLGRVIITKLRPGKSIHPHTDSGDHAAYYERYHFALQCLPGAIFYADDEQVQMPSGSVWWFQNKSYHSVVNNSADDRLVMIVDVRQ